MDKSTKFWMCLAGVALVALGVLCIVYPDVSAETIAVLVGIGIILDGIGYWVHVALVNKVENQFAQLQNRIASALEEVSKAPEA